MALGSHGELYIADSSNDAIRLVDATGKIHTIVGTGAAGFGGDGGPATQAKLLFPEGIALDSRGNLYIADSLNHRIRRVTPDGIISTYAGTGEQGYSGDGGLAVHAKLNWPYGIAINADGVLYFTDSDNNMVRKITPDGVITKVAVHSLHRRLSFNPAWRFDSPRGIALGPDGSLYVADRNHARICKIDSTGMVTVVAGDGDYLSGVSPTEAPGDGGAARKANIPYPTAVAIDAEGNLLIAAGKIRRVDHSGVINTILGARQDRPILENGDPLQTRTDAEDVVVDPQGNIYVADTYRNRILRLSSNGRLSVVAGLDTLPEEKDGGPATNLRLSDSWGVAMGPAGDVFIADTEMNRIVRITQDGRFHRVAGKGVPIFRMEGYGPPPQFSGDGGPATVADLDYPFGVAVDSHGAIYISDSTNNRIRKVGTDGIIETIAGTGAAGSSGDGGPARKARLSSPSGVAVDSHGNVYVADCDNNRIRQISPDGTVRTVVVGLKGPHGVAVDAKDTLFIADTFNHLIKRLDPDGKVHTIAGTGNQEFSGDEGPAAQAGLAAPDSLAIDSQGNIFIADRGNWRVRKITPDGIIHTIAGNHEMGFSGDGGPALKAPIFPTGVAVDSQGRVYVTDKNRIRVLTPAEK
ncbi:MAG: hypothetical protein WB424_02680 [Terracidiphilus sp.]